MTEEKNRPAVVVVVVVSWAERCSFCRDRRFRCIACKRRLALGPRVAA